MNQQNPTGPSITFCINELDVGGAEKALVQIAIGLSRKGWNVRVISLRDAGELTKTLLASEIPVTALACGGFADVRTFWRLSAELRAHRPDVLCCFLHQSNIYGRLAGRRAKVPLVISGVRVADRRRWVIASDRCTRCCVDHYVAVSRGVASLHGRLCRISPDRISAIPNGVDVSVTRDLTGTTDDGLYRLLFVGRLTEQKSPFDLFEAYRRLPKNTQERTTLTFAGDGPLSKKLHQQIEQHDLGQSVQLLGKTSDVEKLMRQATLLVLPSKWEGMPNVVLEAMAIGLPVVATAVDGTQELIDHGKNGWLVPSGNPRALAATISAALENAEDRLKFAKAAQVVAAERFSWQEVIGEYDRLLRRLLDSKTA